MTQIASITCKPAAEAARVPPGGPADQAVGFLLHRHLGDDAHVLRALDRVLRHFPALHRYTTTCGQSTLVIWGHGDPTRCLWTTADGALHVLIGSPHRVTSTEHRQAHTPDATARRDGMPGVGTESLPWDGRCVHLRIDSHSGDWDAWCDWVGSIPILHARCGRGLIATTLEPLAVAATGANPGDFLTRGLYAMLAFGHPLGNDTLFRQINVLPADCHARWSGDDLRITRLNSVQPTDLRWTRGWDELRDELYDLTIASITNCLSAGEDWVLPLSGGMDSRLIAAVGSQNGVRFDAYTYGDFWNEATWARQVANALQIPWRAVDMGTSFHGDFSPLWADWFGSLIHFHGMYQMPLLTSLRGRDDPRIVSGYLGDPLAGNHTEKLMHLASGGRLLDCLRGFDTLWSDDALAELLHLEPRPVLDELEELLREQYAATRGAEFQRLLLVDLWTRQRRLIFYQPTMYHYHAALVAPFMDRDYASFWLSLPRCALSGRALQKDLLRVHWPRLARINGSFTRHPLRSSWQYDLRRRVALALPERWRRGPLREWNVRDNTTNEDCFRNHPEESLWPIREAQRALDAFLDQRALDRTIRQAQAGDPRAGQQVSAIQALALCWCSR